MFTIIARLSQLDYRAVHAYMAYCVSRPACASLRGTVFNDVHVMCHENSDAAGIFNQWSRPILKKAVDALFSVAGPTARERELSPGLYLGPDDQCRLFPQSRAPRNSFSARCNIYISRLCYDVNVRLSVRLSVTEVHWRIIANLGFKFRWHFTAHCGRHAACGRIISRHASQC